jgi:hypothetical protein
MATIADQGEFASDRPVRRDSAPHRGLLFMLLAMIAVEAGSTAIFGVPGLVAVPLGAIVAWMAHHDLRCIARGDMDPQGNLADPRGTECWDSGRHAWPPLSWLVGVPLPPFLLLGRAALAEMDSNTHRVCGDA